MIARRRAIALLLAGAAVIAVIVPLLTSAVQKLSLPLADTAAIRREAAAEHLDPALIAAVIYVESGFDPRTSPAGAVGLMQVLPSTARYLAQLSGGTSFAVGDLSDPALNIRYGSYYLRSLLDHYAGDETLALAAYNAGETNVDRWRAATTRAGLPFTISSIRFPETRAYVVKALAAQDAYTRTYAVALGL